MMFMMNYLFVTTMMCWKNKFNFRYSTKITDEVKDTAFSYFNLTGKISINFDLKKLIHDEND